MPRIRIEPPDRAQQAGQALDRRGLAGAVRAEEAVEAAGRHGKVDAVHRAEVPERPREPVRLDGEIHGADSIQSAELRRRHCHQSRRIDAVR